MTCVYCPFSHSPRARPEWRATPAARQSGAVLFMGLIMLVAMTLLAVSAIRMSNTNLRVASNMQVQAEATMAAQTAIDNLIGTLSNFYTPTASSASVDINNDGTADYTVAVSAPACLSLTAAEGYSVEFAASAPKDTYWNIQAVATDTRTGVSVTVNQGVRVRLSSSATC